MSSMMVSAFAVVTTDGAAARRRDFAPSRCSPHFHGDRPHPGERRGPRDDSLMLGPRQPAARDRRGPRRAAARRPPLAARAGRPPGPAHLPARRQRPEGIAAQFVGRARPRRHGRRRGDPSAAARSAAAAPSAADGLDGAIFRPRAADTPAARRRWRRRRGLGGFAPPMQMPTLDALRVGMSMMSAVGSFVPRRCAIPAARTHPRCGQAAGVARRGVRHAHAEHRHRRLWRPVDAAAAGSFVVFSMAAGSVHAPARGPRPRPAHPRGPAQRRLRGGRLVRVLRHVRARRCVDLPAGLRLAEPARACCRPRRVRSRARWRRASRWPGPSRRRTPCRSRWARSTARAPRARHAGRHADELRGLAGLLRRLLRRVGPRGPATCSGRQPLAVAS